jgi:predicted ATPase/transcriptional regulator with XRE-family HTH domain
MTAGADTAMAPVWSQVLRALREARGVTQEGWAAQLGVGRRTVQRWEQGLVVPDPTAEAAILEWCEARASFRRYEQGALAGISVTPTWLSDLLAEARLGREQTSALPSPPSAGIRPATMSALPATLSSLVGREMEIAAITRLLGTARLLTLTGPGGAGKTRLAVAVAGNLLDTFRDGVVFVDLAPLADASLVPASVAQALGLREAAGRPLISTIADFLRNKRLLMVLDNFEHLMDAAPLVTDLLRETSTLRILVTSRAPLRLTGEQEYPVPPLGLPDPRLPPTVETLWQSAAVRLFVQRVQAVRPDFALSPENAPAVAEICRRLDGLPLAIELAAARTRVLPPEALLARLDERLRVLAGGPRDLPRRQQTLRDTIAWSYELLGPSVQLLFRKLAVFAGGCTLSMAEATCDPDGDPDLDLIEGLATLVEQSLVLQQMEPDGQVRFRMLETIREFALERLEQSGEAERVRALHAAACLAMAETAGAGLRTANRYAWQIRLEREHDNMRAALAWSLSSQPGSDIVRSTGTAIHITAALGWFWSNRGYLQESRRWAERVLDVVEGSPASAAMATVLFHAGDAAANQGDPAAAELLHRCVSVARTAGAPSILALSLNSLGRMTLDRGDQEQAIVLHTNAVQHARESADQWVLALVLADYGTALVSSDPTAAQAAGEESLALWRALGDSWGIGMAVRALGDVLTRRGDLPRARTLYEEHVERSGATEDDSDIAMMHHLLGMLAQREGDFARASSHMDKSLACWRRAGNLWWVSNLLSRLGQVAQRLREFDRAEAYFNEALTLYQAIGNQPGAASVLITLGIQANGRGETERAAALLREGLLLSREMGIAALIAGGLEAIAGMSLQRESGERAARLLGAAAMIRGSDLNPRPVSYQELYDRMVDSLRGIIGEEAFAAAYAEGRAVSVDAAVAMALEQTRST